MLSLVMLTGYPGPRISQDLLGSKNCVILKSGKLLTQEKTLDSQPNEGLNMGDFVEDYYKLDVVTLSSLMLTGYPGPRVSQYIL